MKGQRGFLILEILIACLILTASIAATMYLFRVGIEALERANISNVLSSKLPQAINLISDLDLENKTGTENLGDTINLHWDAKLLEKTRPMINTGEGALLSPYELYTYSVGFRLDYRDVSREYRVNVFRYKRLFSPTEILF